MIIKYINQILLKNKFPNLNKTAQLQSLKISNKIYQIKLILIKTMKISKMRNNKLIKKQIEMEKTVLENLHLQLEQDFNHTIQKKLIKTNFYFSRTFKEDSRYTCLESAMVMDSMVKMLVHLLNFN